MVQALGFAHLGLNRKRQSGFGVRAPWRKMIPRLRTSVLLVVLILIGILFSGPAVRAQAPQREPAGKTRTYYVAADEVNWDYAPSGRDEAMGMPFDDIRRRRGRRGNCRRRDPSP